MAMLIQWKRVRFSCICGSGDATIHWILASGGCTANIFSFKFIFLIFLAQPAQPSLRRAEYTGFFCMQCSAVQVGFVCSVCRCIIQSQRHIRNVDETRSSGIGLTTRLSGQQKLESTLDLHTACWEIRHATGTPLLLYNLRFGPNCSHCLSNFIPACHLKYILG